MHFIVALALVLIFPVIVGAQIRNITLQSTPVFKEVTVTPTLSPTPTPTATPEPRNTPSLTPSPKKQVEDKKSGEVNIHQHLIDQINQYRKSKGLATVKTDSYTCNFAKLRVKEISQDFNHNGFRERISSKSLPYPSYKEITENIATNSNYKKVVKSWISSPGHATNIEKDTPFVCIGVSGNHFAYEGWKP